MSDVVLRAVFGELIDALADRCKAHERHGDLVADVERIERLASDDTNLKRRAAKAIEGLLDARADNDADGYFLTSVLERLGMVRGALPADQAARAADRPGGTTGSGDDLSRVSALVADQPPLLAKDIFTPAELVQRDGAQGAWVALPDDLAAVLFRYVGMVDGIWAADSDTTSAWVGRLPFYHDVQLLRLYDPLWGAEHMVIYYLLRGNALYRLNGNSPPIHEVNEKSIALSDENVLDYLRFFCFFVRGEEGPFYVCEREDDPMLSADGDGNAAPEILPHIKPATVVEMVDANFKVEANLMYSNAVFAATLLVQKGGMVEMLDDEPLVSDLPFKQRSKLG